MGYSFLLLVGSNREGTERAQPGVRLDDLARQHNADARPGGATVLTKAEMSVARSDHEPGVINSSVYAGGRKVTDVAIEEAGDWSKRPGHVVWIGLFEPSDELLQRVQQQFDLHPLAIEDAGKAHQHPKLEQYGDGSQGEDYIVYAILDFIVDNYMPVIQNIHDEVEVIEDTVLATTLSQSDIERLYTLRRDLLRLRNAAGPLVEVCNRLEHSQLMPIDKEMQPHFRDVTDHVRRVREEIDALREVLAFAFEASLMAGQAQQNVIARRLAAWAAILAVPTAIAGIYGMNFEHMPELKWAYGYFLVLGVIVAICGTLYVQFRRNGWL